MPSGAGDRGLHRPRRRTSAAARWRVRTGRTAGRAETRTRRRIFVPPYSRSRRQNKPHLSFAPRLGHSADSDRKNVLATRPRGQGPLPGDSLQTRRPSLSLGGHSLLGPPLSPKDFSCPLSRQRLPFFLIACGCKRTSGGGGCWVDPCVNGISLPLRLGPTAPRSQVSTLDIQRSMGV